MEPKHLMELKHLVVAIDDSAAGRNAAMYAGRLASRTGAKVTILSVHPAVPREAFSRPEALKALSTMLGREVFASNPSLEIELAVVQGVPQVEIPRFAENVKGDLIVLGRKPRSRTTRLILGDTADAVVRRSRLPTLMVPLSAGKLRRVLLALDGTDRGLSVFRAGGSLAQSAGLDLHAVTVEPVWPGEVPLISARSERLMTVLEEGLVGGEGHGKASVAIAPLRIRHGDIVEEIVAEAAEVVADVVVTGFHPGGPLLVAEQGSVSRRLIHAAPCAVLTIPL